MQLSEFTQILKKEIILELAAKKSRLSEGLLDSIIGSIIDKIVSRKYKDYFDEVRNDPEFQAAKQSLDRYAKKARDRMDRYDKAKAKWEKDFKATERKHGKAAAEKIHGKRFMSYAVFSYE